MAEIEQWARACGATVHRQALESQFRCNGSDGYLAWLDNTLQIRLTANEDLTGIHYDLRVCETPNELMDLIEEKNAERNKARAVAGYCWDWITKKAERSQEYDIVIEEHDFRRRWNLDKDGSLWIRMPDSVNEVGCIHTCQGLEVDYVGVIIGPDLLIRNGEVVTLPENRSRMDSTIKGYKKALREDADAARRRAERIIKNTYRTLMSRGQKGCYVFCTDGETAEYFRQMAGLIEADSNQATIDEVPRKTPPAERYPGLPLRVLEPAKIRPFENCVPIYDMEIAAGGFEVQSPDLCEWVELPDSFRPREGHFVVRVLGESMNRRIPNGAWCLFKSNPGGTRDGKIVIVEHRDIQDPDTGAGYTVKRYRSEKVRVGDSWRHRRVVLSPESSEARYSDIVLDRVDVDLLRVVGEFVAVL